MSLQHAIETLSGSYFDFDRPSPYTVQAEDIAVALANTCRFGGHVKEFYSVAEHAVVVYWLVRDAGFMDDVCFAALHHDSHEAYLGDCPLPLKRKIKEAAPGVWQQLETDVDRAVCSALRIDRELLHHDAVKAADAMALSWEAAKLKPSGAAQTTSAPEGWVKAELSTIPTWAVQGWSPETAAQQFYELHLEAARRCRG